jgi:hypothetical protein
MQPSSTSFELPSQRHTLRRIIIVIIAILVVGVATFFTIRYVQHINIENDVKNEVVKQNKVIRATAVNGSYRQTLPQSIASTKTVTIDAMVSTTGTAYCIAATSKSDKKVVYHMDENTPENVPAQGDCGTSASVIAVVPGDVSVASTGTADVTLQWTAGLYATGYATQCAPNESFTTGLKIKTTANLSVIVDGLAGDTQYFCRVAATNQLGQSAWSPIVQARTTLYSQPPTNMKANIVSNNELSYSWDAVPGAEYYMLQYTTDINFVKDVTTVRVDGTSGSVKGLLPYTGYFFRAEAVTANFDATSAAYSAITFARTTH